MSQSKPPTPNKDGFHDAAAAVVARCFTNQKSVTTVQSNSRTGELNTFLTRSPDTSDIVNSSQGQQPSKVRPQVQIERLDTIQNSNGSPLKDESEAGAKTHRVPASQIIPQLDLQARLV